MLPDYPKAKKKIQKIFNKHMKESSEKQLGPFRESQRLTIHEGNKMMTESEGGAVDVSSLRKFEETIEISLDEMNKLTHEELLSKFTEAAESVGRKISDFSFDRIKEITDKTGNIVNAKGRPFSPDLFLEMLEKIWIDFDENGKPQYPTVVVAPGQVNYYEKAMQEIFEKEDLKKRHDEIIEAKRKEWHERENNRKLVG